MRMRPTALVILSALAATLSIAGCGGGTTTTTATTTGKSIGGFTQINDFTLQPTLKVLPTDGTVTISNVTSTSVTLSGAVPALEAGSVILSNVTLPDGTFGLLRKVVSVTTSGGATVVQTTDGDMADVFQTANIHQDTPFPAAAFANAKPGMAGISFGPTRSASSRATSRGIQDLVTLPVDFNHVLIQAPDGTLLAEINGRLEITMGFETQLQFNTINVLGLQIPKGVRTFIAAPYVNINCPGIKITTKAKGNFTKRFSISDPENPVQYTFPLGPISISAKLGLFAQLDGSFDGTGSINVSGSKSIEAGLGVGEAVGKGENQFGAYVVNPDPDLDVTTDGIYPHVAMVLSATVLQGEVTIGVAGLGGAYARADAVRGNLSFDYKLQAGRYAFFRKLDGEVKATVGANLRILNIVIFKGEMTPLDFQWNIHYLYSFDSGQNTAPPSGPDSNGSGNIGITLK